MAYNHKMAEHQLEEINKIYQGFTIKSENSWPFKSNLRVEGLEEIGRDPHFRSNLKATSSDLAHSGIIVRPKKKPTVMIIGNHSAGKSSFINWYIGKDVQKTGIGLETSHFTFISHGHADREILSEGTMNLYPFLRELRKNTDRAVHGTFFRNLTTQVVHSQGHSFSHIDIIDTPGLTDGRVQYNCDIVSVIKWLAEFIDYIVVFFDPIGQALCEKTMSVFVYLSEFYPKKLQAVLSKVDQIHGAQEYTKVHSQIMSAITQDLGLQPGLRILPISLKECKETENEIQELCDKIQGSLSIYVEDSIDKSLRDAELINEHCFRLISGINSIISKRNLLIVIGLLLIVGVNLIMFSDQRLFSVEGLVFVNFLLLLIMYLYGGRRKTSSANLGKLRKFFETSERAIKEIQIIADNYYCSLK